MNGNEIQAASRTPEIPQLLHIIEDTVTDIEETVSALSTKLMPIMAHQADVPHVEADEMVPLTEIGTQLNGKLGRLRGLRTALRDILERAEV